MSNDWYIFAPSFKQVIDIGGKSECSCVLQALKYLPSRVDKIPERFLTEIKGSKNESYVRAEDVTFFGRNPSATIQMVGEDWYTSEQYPNGIPSTFIYLLDRWLSEYGHDSDLFVTCDSGDAYLLMKSDDVEIPYPRIREGWELDSIYEEHRKIRKVVKP